VTSNDSLIILTSNPEKGTLKTRLASEMGDDQAMLVHYKLQRYTKEITKRLNCDKSVFYSDRIDNNDLWDNMMYDKHLQQGADQGERMTAAFTYAFAQGKDRVIIIGTDCMELETYSIKEAFAVLESNDVVLGPSKNGGYYLIGVRKFLPTLFEDKRWDSDNLLMDTILDLKKINAEYYLLKTLNHINSSKDLDQLANFQEKPEDWF
jgi:uncharacterized protein